MRTNLPAEPADGRRLRGAKRNGNGGSDVVRRLSEAKLAALYRKLEVHGRTGAVARALAFGLLEQAESPG